MTASIHRVLLAWILGALAVGAALLVAGSYWALQHEMGEVFEDNLKQVALAVATHHGSYGVAASPPRLAQQLPRVYEEYGKFEFVTAVWDRDGRLLHSSDPAVRLPFLSRSGLTEAMAGGERWYLYTIVLEDGIVQAAQRTSERQTLARETASQLVLPAALLLTVIAVLLTLALQRGLEPLSRAAADVAARSAEALHPIEQEAYPPELHRLVGATNDLMARLGTALAVQRRFVADAAHELRTPIAALRLQLQLLERAPDGTRRERAAAELRAGVDRAQHLVEQLLQLSRLDPDTPALEHLPVSLAELARSAVSQFSARADAGQLDLGAVVSGEPIVLGDRRQLAILLNNLVDNALRCTPAGGRIDVGAHLADGVPCLLVSDTGPGIPAAERERVFDRFYSPAQATGGGSGLGLAIVKAVARQHGAAVTLGEPPGGGLCVTVRFPPVPAPPSPPPQAAGGTA